ncbi:MAG: NAD(P)H-hydrate dehydratase [Ramlibacter sp.]
MHRLTPDRPWPLFDAASSRAIEKAAGAALPVHALMQRAGLALARLALALAPRARCIWIACGPGNNGGDGLEAARHLTQWGKTVTVTWSGDERNMPADAEESLRQARAAGVVFLASPPPQWDLAIDAMLGLGRGRPLEAAMAEWAGALSGNSAPVLAVDLPSGLDADTGTSAAVRASHTLSLLTLKPGLFMAGGRDACGEVWFDDLGVTEPSQQPNAWLGGPAPAAARVHASHKGNYGDVAIIGGAPGMTGAALLAASAALHAGAGRVFAGLLDGGSMAVDVSQPELMFRDWDTLNLAETTIACGCGGGDAVRAVLPKVLGAAGRLVLDADALNAIAADTQLQSLLMSRSRRGRVTVLTPHPLEAARLLEASAAKVQEDRLHAAGVLVERYGCVVALKGSGSVIAGPGRPPVINPTGNARLSTAGTGDVLAGMIAARMAGGAPAFEAATGGVFDHGLAADRWPAGRPLTASALARA